jgi:16S rRNA (guanine527-N7)-methyltransferase
MSAPQQLARGLHALGIEASETQQHALLAYLALLAKWNRVYNLTAIREEALMVTHHLLDALAVLSHVACSRLLDVGSGAGLPGIVLAIMRPDLEVVSVEAVDKKCSFQMQAKAELGLKNFQVRHARIEQLAEAPAFDGIISRAFSELECFVAVSQHLLATKGYLYAMKGVYPSAEIEKLPEAFVVDRVIQLEVPELHAARHLLIIQRR